MRHHQTRLPALGLTLAAVALTAACAGSTASEPATPATPLAPTTTSAPSTGSPATADPSPAPTTAASTAPTTGATDGVEPVNCGAVGPEGGAQVDLIADSTAAGRVGCTEAINVISAYYRDAAMAEGTGRHLAVQGWQCSADTGAYGSGSIGCSKAGLGFHTQP